MISDFAEILRSDQIQFGEQIDPRYWANTIDYRPEIMGVLIPRDKKEVSSIVKLANKSNISLYPISTGKNWGYGSGNPPSENCIILDLGNLNKISKYNKQYGTIRIGPGVTQGDLHEFLISNGHNHIVHTTGAGPSASILGNLCERGYGPLPNSDSYSSVIQMEVVLPNGEFLNTGFEDFGKNNQLKDIFKHPPGPAIVGLFTQSSLGIVTSCTIQLHKRPENTSIFTFKLKGDEKLVDAVDFLRGIKQDLGTNVGTINLMNTERTEAMKNKYVSTTKSINEEFNWTVVGTFYGTNKLVEASVRETRSRLKKSGISKKLLILGPKNIGVVNLLLKYKVNLSILKSIYAFLEQAQEAYLLCSGVPQQLALPLAYLGVKKNPDKSKKLNPALDGCGLLWFAPLIPCDGKTTKEFCNEMKSAFLKHEIPPLITLSLISNTCIDSTIPIDPKDSNRSKRAENCYNDLMSIGEGMGLLPYRISSSRMKDFYEKYGTSPYNKFILKLKEALDERFILSPGRYVKEKK